jgi:hypothetical protein
MEVHHPHHPTHKKKWSEYIIEFVMLFTAVTLGFFAENIREHISENEKKQELMQIVSLDLERDLKQLEFHREDASSKLATCDSIYPILKMDPKKINLRIYYHLLLNHIGYWDFNPNDKSRNEADAKGYFRNEENTELAFYISKINFFLLDYKTLENESVRLRSKLKELSEEMTEHEYYNNCMSLKADLLPNKIGIKPIDPKVSNKVAYTITNFKLLYLGYLGDIDSLKMYSNKAIELINKKYK